MSLAAPILGFLRAHDSRLNAVHQRFAWGSTVRNPRTPAVADANRSRVYDAPTPTRAELRDAFTAAQKVVEVGYEQVEIIDIDRRADLVAEVGADCGAADASFVLMALPAATVLRGPVLPTGVRVREEPISDARHWRALIDAGHADQAPLPEAYLEQQVVRDTTLVAQAGGRLLVAVDGTETLSYGTRLSLAGATLIDSVATFPAHRRRGLAAAVVIAAVTAGRAEGDELAFLFADEHGDARRLYAALGFDVVARVAQFHRRIATAPRGGQGAT